MRAERERVLSEKGKHEDKHSRRHITKRTEGQKKKKKELLFERFRELRVF